MSPTHMNECNTFRISNQERTPHNSMFTRNQEFSQLVQSSELNTDTAPTVRSQRRSRGDKGLPLLLLLSSSLVGTRNSRLARDPRYVAGNCVNGNRTQTHCRKTLDAKASRPRRTASSREPRGNGSLCSSRYVTDAIASRRCSLGSLDPVSWAWLTSAQNFLVARHAVASTGSRVLRKVSSSSLRLYRGVVSHPVNSGYGQ